MFICPWRVDRWGPRSCDQHPWRRAGWRMMQESIAGAPLAQFHLSFTAQKWSETLLLHAGKNEIFGDAKKSEQSIFGQDSSSKFPIPIPSRCTIPSTCAISPKSFVAWLGDRGSAHVFRHTVAASRAEVLLLKKNECDGRPGHCFEGKSTHQKRSTKIQYTVVYIVDIYRILD